MLPALLALLVGAPPEIPLMARVRAAQGPVTLARGDTVQIEVESRLRELPRGDLDGRVSPTLRAPGLTVLEWTEEIEVRPGRNSSTVITAAIVRADVFAPLGPARVGARIDVFDADPSRPVAISVVDVVVNVVPPRATVADVDRNLAAYKAQQARAEQGARIVPAKGSPLRLDKVEMPSQGPLLTGTDRLALHGYLASRLRADTAREHLRAAGAGTSTRTADAAVIERAVRALASLADPPPRSGTPRPPPLNDPVRAVDQGIALFDRLELDLAHRVLTRARGTAGLPLDRLADTLVRLGAIEAARGDDEAAAAAIGQAVCLKPALPPPSKRPPMAEAFESIKRRARCTKALGYHSARASPATTAEDGAGVRVRVLFGPDPFHAIERGTIELIDASGAVRASRDVAAERGDLAALDVVFSALEVGLDGGDAITARARVHDTIGIELARMEPERIPLVVEAKPFEGEGVAWWVWVLGGVAVAAAGATTAALVASGGEPEHAIGPTTVRF